MTLGIHLYKRIMRRGRVIGLLALASVPGLVFWLSAFDADDSELTALYTDILASVGYTFAIAALILTTATLRDERDSGTLPYIYMRPLSRLNMAAQSIAAGMAAAIVIGLGGWIASVVALLAVGGDLEQVEARARGIVAAGAVAPGIDAELHVVDRVEVGRSIDHMIRQRRIDLLHGGKQAGSRIVRRRVAFRPRSFGLCAFGVRRRPAVLRKGQLRRRKPDERTGGYYACEARHPDLPIHPQSAAFRGLDPTGRRWASFDASMLR